jgi:CelD/BcsL family acetyltransferase involved in cellulose biosynthesis
MHVRLLTKPEEFAALQSDWDRLYRRCACRSIFLSHAWFDAAWQWCRMHKELYILCCERDGQLVGVLPLARQRSAGVMPRKTLEFLAVPDTQRCDLLVADEDAGPVAAAFAEELAQRQADWDMLDLRALASRASALTALAAALRDRGFICDVQSATANAWVALDSRWETYYATRSRRLKKALNLAANKLARAGVVNAVWLGPGTGDAADVGRALDAIIRISGNSWKTRTGNSLDNSGPQSFIRRLTQHAHQNGWLSIWMLTLDDVPISMEYQLVADGDVYALRSDFEVSRESLSPGSHLARRMLEGLFARGLKRYYMGPGDNAYKYRWAEHAEPVYTMSVFGRSLLGRGLAVWKLVLRPAALRIRNLMNAPKGETAEASDDGPGPK